MSTIHIVAFSVVTSIETFIICVGNAFAILFSGRSTPAVKEDPVIF